MYFHLQGRLQDLIISFKEKAIAKQCPKAHIGMHNNALYHDGSDDNHCVSLDCRFSAPYLELSSSDSLKPVEEYNELLEEVNVTSQ